MMRRLGYLAQWRPAIVTATIAGFLVVSLAISFLADPLPGGPGMAGAQEESATPVATPVATAPHDPLDGIPPQREPREADPLDGALPTEDQGAPEGQQFLAIARSGRPNDAPPTQPAYDGDPDSIWTLASDAEQTWVWFDLGADSRLREVRWLTRGSGAVDLAVSSDRKSWTDVDRVATHHTWQGIPMRADARYVRLTLLPDDDGQLPQLAEVAVYGRPLQPDDAVDQDARDERPQARGRDRQESTASRQRANGGNESSRERRQQVNDGGGRVRVSAEPGETRCKGKRARCRAREGRVSVEEDCATTGSCTIDVRADGGTAVCDTSGGNKSRAGDGEGKRGGDGGRCEAVADGGTVTIGDINP
jgi:hypothetical protein